MAGWTFDDLELGDEVVLISLRDPSVRETVTVTTTSPLMYGCISAKNKVGVSKWYSQEDWEISSVSRSLRASPVPTIPAPRTALPNSFAIFWRDSNDNEGNIAFRGPVVQWSYNSVDYTAAELLRIVGNADIYELNTGSVHRI